MSDWKAELGRFLTGETKVYNADTFNLENGIYNSTEGTNLLGQQQGTSSEKYLWVQVQVPETYSLIEVKNIVAKAFNQHSSYFKTRYKKYWHDGILFDLTGSATEAADKVKAIAEAAKAVKTDDDTFRTKIAIATLALSVIVLLVLFLRKKK